MTCFTRNLEEIIYKAESSFFKVPLPNSLGDDSASCHRSLVSRLQPVYMKDPSYLQVTP